EFRRVLFRSGRESPRVDDRTDPGRGVLAIFRYRRRGPRPGCLLALTLRRRFLLDLRQARDPDSAVDVVEIDQPFVRLRTPGEREVGTPALGIARPEARNFPALPIQVAAQLA